MTTIVYYNHDGGDLRYEQFENDEEAVEWMQNTDYKAYVIEGLQHTVHDHT